MLLSILYYTILILFLIVYGIFISLVWLLTVWWDKQKRIIAATTYVHAMMLFWLSPGWKIEVRGRENYNRRKPYVMICNHQGMFDIPLIYAIRPNTRWVAKKELIKMPFVGHALLIHGDILIRRGEAASARHILKKAGAELEKGVCVTIFPEGTRLRSGKMNRFHEGAFLLAKRAGVEILPVVLDGTADAFNGWKQVHPHKFRLHVLPPIPVETVKSTGVKELAALARDRVLAEHREMRPELYRE
ncbi:MAG: 1-acyl-sn-glycerol-3-phosphate acyltransferase [Rikenellaceae bacterium]|nr:1-acyl-sn-glycerol-3-phosphate acyltransferase [Rikenellaceae bacterium]